LLNLTKLWRPRRVLGYGGGVVPANEVAAANRGHGLSGSEVLQSWLPIIVLVVVVVAWTGPWSKLPGVSWYHAAVAAKSSVAQGGTITAAFDFKPWVGGTAILASWILVALFLRVSGSQLAEIWRRTWRQM